MSAELHVLPLPEAHAATRAICDLEAERSLLGAALVSGRVIEPVATETGLSAEHFSAPGHRALWAAAERLVADGGDPEPQTLRRMLPREHANAWPVERIDQLVAAVPSVANAKRYAERVMRAWRLEQARQTHLAALEAVVDGDETALAAAEARQHTAVAVGGRHTDPRALGADMARGLSETPARALPLPWPTLARRFHPRPGHTTVLGAWTSMGKSVLGAMWAEHVGRRGGHAVIWTNEMSEEELVARHVQHETRLPADRVLDGDIPADRAGAVLDCLANLPFGTQECFGWNAVQIARHIRQVHPTLAVVDHFHQLPGIGRQDEAEDAVRVLTDAARQSGTHLLLLCQLNHARDTQAMRPPPALRDLRSTGALQSLPNNVLLFHRAQELVRDDDGTVISAVTAEQGWLLVAKQRGSVRDFQQPVMFDPARLRVLEALVA